MFDVELTKETLEAVIYELATIISNEKVR